MQSALAYSFRYAALAALLAVPACQRDAVAPAPQLGESVGQQSSRWSEAATWPGGQVPRAGSVVTIPAGQTVILDVSPPALKGLQIDGTLRFADRDLDLTADWIIVHGLLEIGTSARRFAHRATITLTGTDQSADVMGMGTKVLGVMGGTLEIHGQDRRAWTRLSSSAAKGATQIELDGTVDWKPGDRLVISSTDFDPLQTEEVVVRSVSANVVSLEQPLRFAHWGILQTIAGKTLDERAEVGLLSRNVVIRGDEAGSTTGFGGHIMIMVRSVAHIEGAELHRMGQRATLARYPIHWHVAGPAPGNYARSNSIWRSFNRCITVHGTHEVDVSGNVCYDHLGHGYFLEDGIETKNRFAGNLGLLTRIPPLADRLLGSDSRASTYWITNPDNTYRDNVAAASLGIGFWIALPEHPTGASTNAAIWPRRTPLLEFSGNIAHSNRDVGLNVDNGPTPDGNTETVNYSPRQIPGASSPAVVADFTGFVAWKHAGRAVWLRTTNARLSGALLADNAIGATFASSETFLQDATIIGESANAGIGSTGSFPIRGYEFYDGRVGAQRVTFANFVPNSRRIASALGFNRANGFTVSAANFDEMLTLVSANAVFLETPRADKDGDRGAVIHDRDGSITGLSGAYVVASNPLSITPDCVLRPEWNASICRNRYFNLEIRSTGAENAAPLDISREDGGSARMVGVPGNPKVVAVSGIVGRSYVVQYAAGVPLRPQVVMRNVAAGDFAGIRLPYPDVPINVYRDSDTKLPMTAAASRAELDASSGQKYFHDRSTATLHLRPVVQPGRDFASVLIVAK